MLLIAKAIALAIVTAFFGLLEKVLIVKHAEGAAEAKGREDAQAEGEQRSHDGLADAVNSANEADARHRAHPDDDSGYDQTFRRD